MSDPIESDDRPEVLFVCVHNAGRSQMARPCSSTTPAGRVVVRSAGSAPADDLNPAVIEAMAEVGIDLRATGARPKLLSEAAVEASDVVITMGCGDACPFFPGHALPRLAARRPGRPRASTPCAPSATRSTAASRPSSPSSSRADARRVRAER